MASVIPPEGEQAPVLWHQEGGVCLITLNRPEARNAMDKALRVELIAAFQRAEADASVRVIVLAGAGGAFCAGHDLNDGLGGYDTISETIDAEYAPFLDAVTDSRKIVLAAVNGAAAGIGGALMMACDLAVMGRTAYLYQAFLPIALVPDGGASWHLLQQLGHKRAMEFLLDAPKVPAGRCVELGLANREVDDASVLDNAMDWARQLAAGPGLAQGLTKRLLRQAATATLPEMIQAEADAQNTCSRSEDVEIAVNAFLTKRKPTFVGR